MNSEKHTFKLEPKRIDVCLYVNCKQSTFDGHVDFCQRCVVGCEGTPDDADGIGCGSRATVVAVQVAGVASCIPEERYYNIRRYF
jgi:hypothetical protein